MSKKNPVLGAILGLFVLGLFYAGGLNKRTVIAVIGICVLMSIVSAALGEAGVTVNGLISLGSAFLGYKWAKESGQAASES